MQVGSDVYQLYDVIDVIAHEYNWEGGHRAADKTPLDWLHWMIGMYSFRAFAGEKPTWMLSYSWDGEKGVSPGEEMQNLFASQLAAGTNCWDVRGHVMSRLKRHGHANGDFWVDCRARAGLLQSPNGHRPDRRILLAAHSGLLLRRVSGFLPGAHGAC